MFRRNFSRQFTGSILYYWDLKDTRSHLIVLHQMGSYGPAYFKRCTPAYQPFQPTCNSNAIQGCTADALRNTYDNSIVYTDHVLSQLIQTLAQQKHYQTSFWYLSDHGESTGEHGLYLHGAPYFMAPTRTNPCTDADVVFRNLATTKCCASELLKSTTPSSIESGQSFPKFIELTLT